MARHSTGGASGAPPYQASFSPDSQYVTSGATNPPSPPPPDPPTPLHHHGKHAPELGHTHIRVVNVRPLLTANAEQTPAHLGKDLGTSDSDSCGFFPPNESTVSEDVPMFSLEICPFCWRDLATMPMVGVHCPSNGRDGCCRV